MKIKSIDSPIERGQTKGNPNAFIHYGVPLSSKQRKLLNLLTEYDSRIKTPRKSVNMTDLSALTAETGVEYAMFTKGKERLIIRGDETSVNISIEEAQQLSDDGYRWSGHTHPGMEEFVLFPSDGDERILSCFQQQNSVIYNTSGKYRRFIKE